MFCFLISSAFSALAYPIPPETIDIPNNAFKGNTGLSGTITIPESVKTIGSFAFQGCTGFTGACNIPINVVSIGESAFEGITGFTSLTLPNCCFEIGNRAFKGCNKIAALKLPGGLENLGAEAFAQCSLISGDLTIYDTIKTIGDKAFAGCPLIKKIIYTGLNDPKFPKTAFEGTPEICVLSIYQSAYFCGFRIPYIKFEQCQIVDDFNNNENGFMQI